MKQFCTQFLMVIGLLSLLFVPNSALAAPTTDGIEFRVAYTDGAYEVFMRPNVNVTGPALTLTAQVTLKEPHTSGSDRFTIADLTSAVAGTEWTVSSRTDAPVEDTSADYMSFMLSFPESNHQAFAWQAAEEIKVFSFTNEGSCLGSVELLSNDDPFTSDIAAGRINSANTNPGNQINVMNLGEDNLFAGIYGGAAACSDRNIQLDNYIYLPVISGR